MICRIAKILGIALIYTSALGKSDPYILDGVWSGTVGSSEVTVCFDSYGGWGNFYYHSDLTPVHLYNKNESSVDFPFAFSQSHSKYGTWTLTDVQENIILGSWMNQDRSQVTPINLTRISMPQTDEREDRACRSDKFNLPLEYRREPIYGEIEEINGVHYRKVTIALDELNDYFIQKVEFLGEGVNVVNLNKNIGWSNIENLIDSAHDHMFSVRRSVAASGMNHFGGYRSSTYLTFLGHLIFVHEHEAVEAPRGGASERVYTLNSVTGEKVDVIKWFKGIESMERRWAEFGRLPKSLAEFVFSKIGTLEPKNHHLSKEDFINCYFDDPETIEYDFELTKTSLKFVVPVTNNGSCGEVIEIPFDKLKPFLSEIGLENILKLESIENR